MIEMLGVLAIIAVLSVGGIASYTKAMERYKLIKYREGIVELVSNFIHNYRAWGSHYCKDGETCLSSLTINDIYEICYYYKDKPDTYKYAIQFVFKN